MVLNATFYNNSVISWRSVLVVEETRVPRENIIKVLKLVFTCFEYSINMYSCSGGVIYSCWPIKTDNFSVVTFLRLMVAD